MAILASRSTRKERSFSLPSTLTARAALARPGPMAAAISAPLTGLSNFRTEPSGKEILIMATAREESEHGSSTGAGRRRAEAGKRHECARPAESSSDGGQFRGSGEKQPIHGLGDSCSDGPSQAEVLAHAELSSWSSGPRASGSHLRRN